MKHIITVFLSAVLFLMFFVTAEASEEYYSDLFDALSPEAEKLLEDFGISADVYKSYGEISPGKALETVFGIFKGELVTPVKTAGISLALIFIASILTGFFPVSDSVSLLGKRIALMCIMFFLVSTTGDVFSQCSSSLELTKDFMLVLIPVFAGIISFSGNPALALSFNTVAFAFAEIVAVFFETFFPVLCVVLISISCACAVNPVVKLDSVGRTVSKAINLIMAFVAGIFVAVLSVRGVIAGAADTVTIRGVRFLVGNTLPIVGSAIGEALNSIVAGLGLMKNTVGVLGIAAVCVINLPVLIKVVIWKCALYFIGTAADLMGLSEIKNFSDNMNGVLAVIIASVCYVSFVFIISIAILLTVSKG